MDAIQSREDGPVATPVSSDMVMPAAHTPRKCEAAASYCIAPNGVMKE
jgi:hypothetical protein